MNVTRLVSDVLLSPLPFIAVSAAGALTALRGLRKAGFWLCLAPALCLLALSLEPIHDALLYPLENAAAPLDGAAAVDAVVVLGGGTMGSSPELAGEPGLPPEALKRLVYGCVISRRTGAVLFLSGGRVTRRDVEPEGEIMRRVAVSLGIPPERIVVEGGSATTWENARKLAPVLAARGMRRVALVTSAFHMPRSIMAFRRAGIPHTPAPTDYLTQRTPYTARSFLPFFDMLEGSFTALHEYAGLAAYAVRR
jgi:uncharacterized SAM-binding protein YcdF (DUF218 family)